MTTKKPPRAVEPARRPRAYLQCCHNLAWLALDDIRANAFPGIRLDPVGTMQIAALEAVSTLGDGGFEGAGPEDYESAALDLLNLAATDALDGASEFSARKLRSRKALQKRVDAARALLRGAR